MGTRADFYLGRGKDAVWLGSIAWDGYPSAMPTALREASTEEQFCVAVDALSSRDDWTAPATGWPWPWEDSRTTDYAYAFDDGAAWASCFGRDWFKASDEEPEDDNEEKTAVFPNMKSRQSVTLGPRSGILLFGVK